MKLIHNLVNERFAKRAAGILLAGCYFVMVFLLICLFFACIGRQTFQLRTSEGFYERAIYAEENHAPHSRSMTVSINDEIRVQANRDDQIDLGTGIALAAMYACHVIPLLFAYWFLSRVFANIQEGRIFTLDNASYLLYYGVLRLFYTLGVPLVKLLIVAVANLLCVSQISISTGHNLISDLFPSIVFLVAAYILQYGVSLQDEVDHTL